MKRGPPPDASAPRLVVWKASGEEPGIFWVYGFEALGSLDVVLTTVATITFIIMITVTSTVAITIVNVIRIIATITIIIMSAIITIITIIIIAFCQISGMGFAEGFEVVAWDSGLLLYDLVGSIPHPVRGTARDYYRCMKALLVGHLGAFIVGGMD